MPSFLREGRPGLRMLARNPGLTAVAVLTLGLGIGSTSSVFSLIHGVLLTPPPYRDADRIVLISPARTDGQPYSRDWTVGQFLDFQKETRSFDAVASYDWTFDFLVLPDGSDCIYGMGVTKEYFKVLGIKPRLGREFLESEAPAKYWDQTVVILGHGLWQRRFNGNPRILGRKVRFGIFSTPLTVVGVMPPMVRFLPSHSNAHEPNYDVNAQVDFWIPIVPDPATPKENWCNAIARLRPGATLTQARTELTSIAGREAQADRDFEGIVAKVEPITAELNHEGQRLLYPLFGAVILVFLIACGNVAGLLLARGVQRQGEYAVHAALGARRLQLFRQVLAESLLLALAGAVAGAGLAFVVVRVLKALGGHAIPRLDAVTVGWPVLALCVGSAVLAAVVAGTVPALRASRLDPAEALKGTRTSSVGRGDRRLLSSVAIVQTALTLALLAGALLLVRTVNNLARVNPGYRTEHLLTMNVTDVNWGKYFEFHERALQRLSALPGVKDVAFAWGVPLTGESWMNTIEIEGQADRSTRLKDQARVPTRSVTPNYFDMLGQRIVAGRNFPAAHSVPANGITRARIAIVNEAMAQRYFPNADPVGRKLNKSIEIIGVVANARTEKLTRKAEPEIYYWFWEAAMRTKHLVIQTTLDARQLVVAVQRELRAIEPTLSIDNVKTLGQIRSDSVATQTFAMQLLIGFSAVAIALALVGIYGVLSLSVASRKREIAIRLAVGAQRGHVLALVLREGLILIAVGLVVGTGVGIALGRVLGALLFGVGAADPATFAGGTILFMLVASMACLVPALRATRVDPTVALRQE